MTTDDEKSAESTPDQENHVRGIVVEVARTELAAITAATTFLAGWVAAAEKYTGALGEELGRIDNEQGAASSLEGRLFDLSREYLRNLVELPALAADRFSSELEKIGPPKRKRARVARAKD